MPLSATALQISARDLRLTIMAIVLAAMAVVFHVLTGNFLTPENLYNIAQQTAVVGIVAAAISLVIVARHIDLSVGSVVGFVGVLVAYLQYTAGWHWPAACLAGLGAALLVGAYQLPGKPAGQGIPAPVVIWGAVVIVVAFLVRRTRFGRYVYAIGGNPEAARLVGIPVRRVTLQLFLLLAVTITIAAIVAVSR